MRWGVFGRGTRLPLAIAAGSLGVALAGGCSLAGEISDARRIDASAVCLEASTEPPETVKLCGQEYPSGDDMLPTEGLIVVAGTAGTLMAAGWILMVARQERRDNRRSGSAAHTT